MERETMRKIRQAIQVGEEITPAKLKSLGIRSSTANAFLGKHKVGNGKTTEHFKWKRRGVYLLLPKTSDC